jgi:hypothetical protein
MVPSLPNLLLIPTRGISVFYGIAPLAIDLCVLLVAMVQNLLNFLVSMVPEGILKDLAANAADAVVAGLETFLEARFERDPPASTSEALAEAGRTAAYTFVEGATETLAEAATGALGDMIAGPEGSPTRFLWDAVVADPLQEGMQDLAGEAINELTGGDYQEWQDQRDAADEADNATAPDPLGQITRPMESFGEAANEAAGLAATAHSASEGDEEAMEELRSEAWERSTSAAGDLFNAATGNTEPEEESQVQTEAHDQTTEPERPEMSDPGSLDFGDGGAPPAGGGGQPAGPSSPEETSQQTHQALEEQSQHDAEQPT